MVNPADADMFSTCPNVSCNPMSKDRFGGLERKRVKWVVERYRACPLVDSFVAPSNRRGAPCAIEVSLQYDDVVGGAFDMVFNSLLHTVFDEFQ